MAVRRGERKNSHSGCVEKLRRIRFLRPTSLGSNATRLTLYFDFVVEFVVAAYFFKRAFLTFALPSILPATAHPLPRVRMPMLQSSGCAPALRYLEARVASFVRHKWRYGAGVSTSGSQPENPGSIPGTATKLAR
jgi:hypothetical protein